MEKPIDNVYRVDLDSASSAIDLLHKLLKRRVPKLKKSDVKEAVSKFIDFRSSNEFDTALKKRKNKIEAASVFNGKGVLKSHPGTFVIPQKSFINVKKVIEKHPSHNCVISIFKDKHFAGLHSSHGSVVLTTDKHAALRGLSEWDERASVEYDKWGDDPDQGIWTLKFMGEQYNVNPDKLFGIGCTDHAVENYRAMIESEKTPEEAVKEIFYESALENNGDSELYIQSRNEYLDKVIPELIAHEFEDHLIDPVGTYEFSELITRYSPHMEFDDIENCVVAHCTTEQLQALEVNHSAKYEGSDLLTTALCEGNIEAYKYLLTKGHKLTDLTLIENHKDVEVSSYQTSLRSSSFYATLKELGMSIDSITNDLGRSPLHYAAMTYSWTTDFDELVELGGNITLADNKGRTPEAIRRDVQAIEDGEDTDAAFQEFLSLEFDRPINNDVIIDPQEHDQTVSSHDEPSSPKLMPKKSPIRDADEDESSPILVWRDSLSVDYGYTEPDDYVYKYEGEIIEGNEEIDNYEQRIGRFSASYIDAGEACNDRVSMLDVLDAADMDEYLVLFDDHGWWSDEVENQLVATNDRYTADLAYSNLLVIDYIQILPEHRGRELGLKIIRNLIKRFSNGAGLIALRPYPLQLLTDHNNSDWGEKLQLQQYTMDRHKATNKLAAHYSRLGFVVLEGRDLMIMSNSHVHKVLEKDELTYDANIPLSDMTY